MRAVKVAISIGFIVSEGMGSDAHLGQVLSHSRVFSVHRVALLVI